MTGGTFLIRRHWRRILYFLESKTAPKSKKYTLYNVIEFDCIKCWSHLCCTTTGTEESKKTGGCITFFDRLSNWVLLWIPPRKLNFKTSKTFKTKNDSPYDAIELCWNNHIEKWYRKRRTKLTQQHRSLEADDNKHPSFDLQEKTLTGAQFWGMVFCNLAF